MVGPTSLRKCQPCVYYKQNPPERTAEKGLCQGSCYAKWTGSNTFSCSLLIKSRLRFHGLRLTECISSIPLMVTMLKIVSKRYPKRMRQIQQYAIWVRRNKGTSSCKVYIESWHISNFPRLTLYVTNIVLNIRIHTAQENFAFCINLKSVPGNAELARSECNKQNVDTSRPWNTSC